MTEPTETPARARKSKPVWVVNRAQGLHPVARSDVDGVIEAGGRLATERDLEIGGVGAGAVELETDPDPAQPGETPNEEG